MDGPDRQAPSPNAEYGIKIYRCLLRDVSSRCRTAWPLMCLWFCGCWFSVGTDPKAHENTFRSDLADKDSQLPLSSVHKYTHADAHSRPH